MTLQSQFTEPKKQTSWRLWQKILLAALLVLGVVVLGLYWPTSYQPAVQARPAQSYAEAMTRLEVVQAKDEAVALYPGCETQVMTQGQKVERVMVLLHGYRNCPAQVQQVGLIFYEQGYNVIIPRMPHHGLAEVMTTDQAQLRADELALYVTEAVDIAQGLGEHVTVAGMSTGGVLTAWAAQRRADIEQAALIAPFFGAQAIPAPLTQPAINLFSLLPNFFLWQDDQLQAAVPNPPQVYPQNSTAALSQILRLGLVVQTEAGQSAPAAAHILIITNANDEAVDNRVTAAVVAAWQQHGFTSLQSYEFEAALRLDHDLLDPAHPKQNIALVYPVLVELMTR